MAISIEEMQAEVVPEHDAPVPADSNGSPDGGREAELMERIVRELRVREERARRAMAD